MKCCNLGCGNEYFESVPGVDWVNVDMQTNDGKVDVLSDVSKKLPFVDGEFDIIVASHIAEHLEMSIVSDVIKEWMRTLKKDGKLYLTVPDGRALAEAYVVKDIDNYTFAVNMTGPYHTGVHDHHRWVYDFLTLKDRCKDFNVEKLTWENMPKELEGGKVKLDWWICSNIITHK
jgi:predicted SAM-dependent methyltransferase